MNLKEVITVVFPRPRHWWAWPVAMIVWLVSPLVILAIVMAETAIWVVEHGLYEEDR